MAAADRLLVLTWHAVDERASVISTPPGRFAAQMDQLAAHGLRGVGLAEAFDHREREGAFPRDAVALTFDDGYRSLLEAALPAMARHGHRGTVFLASGLVGLSAREAGARNADLDRDMLGWDEAGELLRCGWEIGSHSVSHPDLTQLDGAACERELGNSRAEIERRLGCAVTSLAYPYGRVDDRVRAAAARHYRLACTTRLAHHRATGDPLRIDRVDTYYLQETGRFDRLLAGRLDGWLTLRRTLRAIRNFAR